MNKSHLWEKSISNWDAKGWIILKVFPLAINEDLSMGYKGFPMTCELEVLSDFKWINNTFNLDNVGFIK